MLMDGGIPVIVGLGIPGIRIDTDHSSTALAPHVLLAQLDHLNNPRPRVGAEPWHPALGGSGLGVLPLGALDSQR